MLSNRLHGLSPADAEEAIEAMERGAPQEEGTAAEAEASPIAHPVTGLKRRRNEDDDTSDKSIGDALKGLYRTDADIDDLGKRDIQDGTIVTYERYYSLLLSEFTTHGYATFEDIIRLYDTELDKFIRIAKTIMFKIACTSKKGSDSPLKQFCGMLGRKFPVG